MNTLQKICLTLTIIGAINWGLVGIFELDLVALISDGTTTMVAKTIYSIIGLAGIVNIGLLFRDFD